jgi:hypothetical protein
MDPSDPRDRSRPGRRAVVGGVAATVIAVGVGWAAIRSSGSTGDGRTRPLSLKQDAEALVGTGMARLVGRRLYAGSDPISDELAAGEELRVNIAGSLVPLAVREDPVTDVVVYSAWRQWAPTPQPTAERASAQPKPVIVGTPSIRVWRGVGGTDELVADGAYSPVVASGGVIAYAKGVTAELRSDGPYLARIVVGSLTSPSTTWWTTTPGRYVPLAWAGSHLVTYTVDGEDESTDVMVYSGPDSSRTLMPSATFIAVSPNGRRVAVADQQGTMSIIDVASGSIVDAVSLGGRQDSSTELGVARPGGDWRGSRIVASTARGLMVLDTVPTLHLAAVHRYTDAMSGGISEPQFVDDDTVIGTARLPDGASTATPPESRAPTALVVCTLSTSACARGSIGPTTFAWRQWVTNWSR